MKNQEIKIDEEILKKIQTEINEILEDKDITSFEFLSEEVSPKDYIDTGFSSLNYIISRDISKGYPTGKFSEICGDPATGKTLLATLAGINALKKGYLVFFLDGEQAYDINFAKLICKGINEKEDLVNLIQYKSIEKVEELTQTLLTIVDTFEKTNILEKVKGGFIIVDGIAFLTTEKEMTDVMKNEEKVDMTKAKLLRRIFRVLKNKIYNLNIGVLFTNQLIYDIGTIYGYNKTTTGGTAIPYASSIRIRLHSKIQNEDNGIKILQIKAKCIKNRLTIPNLETSLNIKLSIDNIAINRNEGLFDTLLEDGKIQKVNNVTYKINNKEFTKRGNDWEKIILEELLKEKKGEARQNE